MVRRLLTAAAVLFGFALSSAEQVSAAPLPLSLPQGTAFAILGHSCGGIQEKAYATGFDPASGYPTGVVLMSTSCGGSGRGGGYHTTFYSASAGVTWDFTGAVVSYVVPAPASTLDPAFSAYDSHGNEVYNQSNNAYLVLAPGFVPVARVSSVAPASGPAAGGTTVTITGYGLAGATGVLFGSVPAASVSVASPTSITATSPASPAGTIDVTVVNAGGTSTTTAGDQFTFAAAPTVAGVSPSSGPPTGGTTVTITGAHLSGVSRVTFGGTAAGFQVNSDTSITAYAPAAEATGAVDVRVTTVGGTSARTSADRFNYTVPRPIVAAVSPHDGPAAGGTEVTITGSNFTAATAVTFGDIATSFAVNDDTSITAYSPGGPPGTVDVTVSASGVRSATGAADRFTYLAAPSITAIAPAIGPPSGGTTVVVSGSGFTAATEVDFGGVPAAFTVASDTSITAVSPAAAAGVVDVTVATAGGTSNLAPTDEFTYVDPPPTVTAVTPAAGPAAGGTLVTLVGTNLTNTTEVDFGGVAAGFAVVDDGTLVAVSPGGPAGVVDATVTTDGGRSASSPVDEFTYVAAPTVTAVTPASGSAAGGDTVTIAGTGFADATEVDIGGVPAAFVVDGDGTITATTPPGSPGTVDVTVTNGGGTSDLVPSDQFAYE